MARVTRLRRDIPPDVREDVLADGECHYCAERLLLLEVEHRRPLSRGGTNERGNLVAACVSCNTQKGTMLLGEWRNYRQSRGMPWPPLASHPTEPRHYGDYCVSCLRAEIGTRMQLIHAAFRIEADGELNVCYFACVYEHLWTRNYWLKRGYYSDCACAYCYNCREDHGDKHWPDTRKPSVPQVA